MKIYLAASLFNQMERQFNRAFSEAISLILPDLEFILPQNFEPDKSNEYASLFTQCVQGIDSSDIVLAILEGSDADSGSSWEIGYAYAKKVPVIAIRTDLRENHELGLNLMLSQSVVLLRETCFKEDLPELAQKTAEKIKLFL